MSFFRQQHGFITIFVTMLLIPTIFFTGFMTDLVRIKFMSNQATMAADNYGESILTYYDNLLKEVYGLYGISQDDQAAGTINKMKPEILASFNMGGSSQETFVRQMTNGLGITTTVNSGWAPYSSQALELSYNLDVPNANLANPDVLATQIGDFMRFRIAQVFFDDGEDIADALKSVKSMEGDSKIINKKQQYDDQANTTILAIKDFYEELKKSNLYYGDLLTVLNSYDSTKSSISATVRAEMDREAAELKKLQDEAKKHNQDIEDGNAEGEPEEVPDSLPIEKIKEMRASYADPNIEEALGDYNETVNSHRLTEHHNTNGDIPYRDYLNSLAIKMEAAEDSLDDLQTMHDNFQDALNTEDSSSPNLKENMQNELDKSTENFEKTQLSMKEHYDGLYEWMEEDAPEADDFDSGSRDVANDISQFKEDFLEGMDPGACHQIPDSFYEESRWNKAEDDSADHELYSSMKNYFENSGSDKKSDKKRKEAKKIQKEAEKVFKQDEKTEARDCPYSELGKEYTPDPTEGDPGEDGVLGKLIGDTTGFFGISSNNSLPNEITDKLMVTAYDFGMFTDRVTNIKPKEGGAADLTSDEEVSGDEVEKTLTNIEKSSANNYMYRAELEYILVGSDSSKKNLNSTRNRILGFRAVINYMASYSIKEINDAIQAIADAIDAVAPGFGTLTGQAVRLAFAAAETAADWDELKSNGKIQLFKNEMSDLTAYDKIAGLLEMDSSAGGTGEDSGGIKMDYNDYVMVMILFFTGTNTVLNRTGNLITINMNYLRYGSADGTIPGSPKFKLRDAKTAVETTCGVTSSLAVLTQGILNTFVPEQAGAITEMGSRKYSYSVYRSY